MHHPGQLAYGLAAYVGLQWTQPGQDGGRLRKWSRLPSSLRWVRNYGRPASAMAGFYGAWGELDLSVSRHVSPPLGEPGYVSPAACQPGHVSPAASPVQPSCLSVAIDFPPLHRLSRATAPPPPFLRPGGRRAAVAQSTATHWPLIYNVWYPRFKKN